MTEMERRRIRITGIVQGVGFRPFVYELATRSGLRGSVQNDAAGVLIEAEGEPDVLDRFAETLRTQTPPLAELDAVVVETIPLNGHPATDFHIAASNGDVRRSTFLSPDVGTCEDCLRELFDPGDRRFLYPFTNCTSCGPRFTIVRELPYDRPATTMADFAMCPDCRREYEDPADRRFHAQPVACPACGPHLELRFTAKGRPGVREGRCLPEVQRMLTEGRVLAVKGLGGYHLACDARNAEAVRRLRILKGRKDKPFAVMAAGPEAVLKVCRMTDAERETLLDRRRPVVLLEKQSGVEFLSEVAPGQTTLGVMLPYTPLHHMLFHRFEGSSTPDLLVMTSGNLRGEPIAYQDEAAFNQLAGCADAFLTHDRAIHIRCDDSVVRVLPLPVSDRTPDRPSILFLRRSRGWAPRPLRIEPGFDRPGLAVGGHLKNTFCLGRGGHAFLSQHIGDLGNLETLRSFEMAISHFERLFEIDPQWIAHDLHPDYLSTQWAARRAGTAERVPVQHHHAHIASVLAENGLNEPVIGVAFDGSGYGPDGTVWGGEFLLADFRGFERLAHLAAVPMPGGEQAVRQPWRMAAAWLEQLQGESWPEWAPAFTRRIDLEAWKVMRMMMRRSLNSPLTSSMGRLFDAVAALAGVRQEVHYEGQAAMELEALADPQEQGAYTFETGAGGEISPAPVFDALLKDIVEKIPISRISARFHNGVARLVAEICEQLRGQTGVNRVALSGGVFQNLLLLTRTTTALDERGFGLYVNRRVPANDGGLALGQAAVANARLKERLCV
ncbi:MAG TPA: carbamoyltransferase HypF [Anaerolineales bacterium]|nr:carbamoyltransferase HypF [Anaerolineales bacterium]